MADVKGTNNDDTLNATGLGDVFYGYYGNDLIKGSNGNDTMYGGADNDTLYGYAGNDSLDGGAGNDSIFGGEGNDYILGGAGLDIIYGGNGNDTVYGGADNDNIQGNDGDDYLDGGAGADTIFAGNGKDTIYGGTGNDSIDTGEGDDLAYAGDGNDIVWGRGGNDTMYGQNGNDTIYAIKGNNEIYGGSGADSLVGGSGNDTIDGGAGADEIVVSSGANRITAGDGNDTVKGGVDNDTVYGGNDNDLIYGGAGNDYIDAGTGDDVVYGGDGNDEIYARGGNDTIYGQNGNDTIYGIAGNNKIYAGAGNDSIIGGVGNDTIDAGDGDDIVTATSGNKYITAGAGNDKITSGTGNDTIFGGAGNDNINAGDGADSIDGGAGNDTILGGAGNDTIYGGAGNDLLNAGLGNNIFNFKKNDGSDTIISGGGEDTLVFDNETNINDINVNISGNNLIITTNNGNSITLNDYTSGNHSVKYVQVGEDKVKISDLKHKVTSAELTINGTALNDSIVSTYTGNEVVTINSGDGDDIVTVSNGSNKIITGVGNDTVNGGKDNDTVYGGNDNDLIYGGAGNDYIDAGTGDDVVYGGDGNDEIYARGGNDTIYGQNGNDTIYGIAGNNKIYAGAGNDSIIGGVGNDTIDAGDGDDIVTATDGTNYITAGAGNDTVTTGSGNDTIFGGAGNDSIIAGAGNDSIDAGAGNDTVYGGAGNDIVNGGANDDLLDGGDGDDSILGGAGNDTIYGRAGNDTIYGGLGNDSINAGAGNNYIHFNKNEGSDSIYSGGGTDTLVFDEETSFDNLTVEQAENDVIITTENGNTVTLKNYSNNHSAKNVKIGAITKTIEELLIGDVIEGTSGNDNLNGTPKGEELYGKEGNDTITAGKGDDTIDGGVGTNRIIIADGDGNDTVLNGGGTDEIQINSVINNIRQNGNDLIISYGTFGEKVTIKDYPGHSVRLYSQATFGNSNGYAVTEAMNKVQNRLELGIKVSGSNAKAIFDNAVNVNVTGNERNYVYASDDGAKLNAGSSTGSNFLIGGRGDDTLIGGSGNDYFAGGNGNNIIYANQGGQDTLSVAKADENNTIIFNNINFTVDNTGKVTNLGNLVLTNMQGEYQSDSVFIKGYGNQNDFLSAPNYFYKGDTPYYYEGYTLQDASGHRISLTDAVKMSINREGDTDYTVGDLHGNSTNEVFFVNSTNEAQKQISSTETYNGYVDAGAGNDTIYSGGIYQKENGGTMKPYIWAGDGNDEIHAQGGKIYFTTSRTDLQYSETDLVAINTQQTNNKTTTTTVYDADHIYITPDNKVMTGYFFFAYQLNQDSQGNTIAQSITLDPSDKYEYIGTYHYADGDMDVHVYHTDALANCKIEGKKTYFFDYGDKVASGQINAYGAEGNDKIFIGNGSSAYGGEGNDTIIGDGQAYGEEGNDKIVFNNDNYYFDGVGFTYYYADGGKGNDYVDMRNVIKREHAPVELSSQTVEYENEYDTQFMFSEGINTLVVNPKDNKNIIVNMANFAWNEQNRHARWYDYGHKNSDVAFGTFKRGDDLYISMTNGEAKNGTLIIKDYFAYEKDANEPDGLKKDANGDPIRVYSLERRANLKIYFYSTIRDNNDYFLPESYMTVDEFIQHYNDWNTAIDTNHDGHKDTLINGEEFDAYYNHRIDKISGKGYEGRLVKETNNYMTFVDNQKDGKSLINPEKTTPEFYETKQEAVVENPNRPEVVTYNTVKVYHNAGYYIIGGDGAQTINGGNGDDVIFGDNIGYHDASGNWVEVQTGGNDKIYAGAGDDYVEGGLGNDLIDGGDGQNVLYGGQGNDTIIAGDPVNTTVSQYGDVYKGGVSYAYGEEGNDVLYSKAVLNNDGTINEAESNKYLAGETDEGYQYLYGGDGNDTIVANSYKQIVDAGAGNDTVKFYNNNGSNIAWRFDDSENRINLGEGNDQFFAYGNGGYSVSADSGNNLIDASNSSAKGFIAGGTGMDTIYGGSGNEVINTGLGSSIVDAGDGDDTIYGGVNEYYTDYDIHKSDIIHGGAGNDSIGAFGKSAVYGDAGDDTISLDGYRQKVPSALTIDGGTGNDIYRGNAERGVNTIIASDGNDKIQFFGVTSKCFAYEQQGNDLLIKKTSSDKTYTGITVLKDYFIPSQQELFNNWTVETYADNQYGPKRGEFTMAEFVDYISHPENIISSGEGTSENDYIESADSVTYIDGGQGNDNIIAGSNAETIKGGAGSDYIVGSNSYNKQVIIGDSGDVTVTENMSEWGYTDGTYTVNYTHGSVPSDGNDNIISYASTSFLFGEGGNDTITVLNGTSHIWGGAGDDVINAHVYDSPNSAYAAEIYGESGNDYIKARAGFIDGGIGNDTIIQKSYNGNNYAINPQILKTRYRASQEWINKLYNDENSISNKSSQVSREYQNISQIQNNIRDYEYYIQYCETNGTNYYGSASLNEWKRRLADAKASYNGVKTTYENYENEVTAAYNADVAAGNNQSLNGTKGSKDLYIDTILNKNATDEQIAAAKATYEYDQNVVKTYKEFVAKYDDLTYSGWNYATASSYNNFRTEGDKAYWENKLSQAELALDGVTGTKTSYDNRYATAAYASYHINQTKLNNYQTYLEILNNGGSEADYTGPKFTDIQKDSWLNKAELLKDNILGCEGTKNVYEKCKIYVDNYDEVSQHDKAYFEAKLATAQEHKSNYYNYDMTYEEAVAEYNLAQKLLDNYDEILTQTKAQWQTQLAEAETAYKNDQYLYNVYSAYAEFYFDEEFNDPNYANNTMMILSDGETPYYSSFRQEAIQNYSGYYDGSPNGYWSRQASLIYSHMYGGRGTQAITDEMYARYQGGGLPYSSYKMWYEENDRNIDEYNEYSSFYNNYDNPTTDVLRKFDDYIGDYTATNLNGYIPDIQTTIDGSGAVYQRLRAELDSMVEEFKQNAPSETALKIAMHLQDDIVLGGQGNDTITIGHRDENEYGSAGAAIAMGQEGNDTYIVEGGYYDRDGNFNNPQTQIYDTQGTNTIKFNNDAYNSGNIGMYANVELVKDENGNFVKDDNGNYRYELKNFGPSYSDSNSVSYNLDRTPLKDGNADYSIVFVDNGTYKDTLNTFNYGGLENSSQGGIKFDTATLNNIDYIWSNDGKYITKAQIENAMQKTANWLAENGYDSFMGALDNNDSYNNERAKVLNEIRNFENLGSLEWITPKGQNGTPSANDIVNPATSGRVGTDTNDTLTISSAAVPTKDAQGNVIDFNNVIDLKYGNDKVTFEGNFGNYVIKSSSTVDNDGVARQSDTISLAGYSVQDGTLRFSQEGTDLVLTAYNGENVVGTVTYEDFLSEEYTLRSFVLKADDHDYLVSKETASLKVNDGSNATSLRVDDDNNGYYNIRFIESTDESSVILDTNGKRSYYYIMGETPLTLGSIKSAEPVEIFSQGTTDNKYKQGLTADVNLTIHDGGGMNDLNIANSSWNGSGTVNDSKFRLFFDVDKSGNVSQTKHVVWQESFRPYETVLKKYGSGDSVYYREEKVYYYDSDNLLGLLNNDPEHMKGAISFDGDLYRIQTDDRYDHNDRLVYEEDIDVSVRPEKYIRSIATDVVPWLKENNYESVSDALTKLKTDIAQKQALMAEVEVDSEEYTNYSNAIKADNTKIDKLLGYFDIGYGDSLFRNLYGDERDNELKADGNTVRIEGDKGNDTITASSGDYDGQERKVIYSYDRGDGHDTILNSNNHTSLYVDKGDKAMYTKFRTSGWDLKIEFYSNAQSSQNPEGSITISNYFKKNKTLRLDNLYINNVQYSINTMIAEQGVLNTNVILGTEHSDNFVLTDGNDIIYTNGEDNSTNDIIPSSKGNDTIFITDAQNNAPKITYIVADGNDVQGDDVIYGARNNTYITINYGDTNATTEYRRIGDDMKMLFFMGTGDNKHKVGSITFKEYYTSSVLGYSSDTSRFNLVREVNGNEVTTPVYSPTLLENYRLMGGSLEDNGDTPYFRETVANNTQDTTISVNATQNTLTFNDVASFRDLSFEKSGSDLVITHNGIKTTVAGYLSGVTKVKHLRVGNLIKDLSDNRKIQNISLDIPSASTVDSYNNVPVTQGTINGSGNADKILVRNTDFGVENIKANGGNDDITVVNNNINIDAGPGDDIVRVTGSGNTIRGGRGNDIIVVTANNSTDVNTLIFDDNTYGDWGGSSYAGNDNINAKGGNLRMIFSDQNLTDFKLAKVGTYLAVRYNNCDNTAFIANYFLSDGTRNPAVANIILVSHKNNDEISLDDLLLQNYSSTTGFYEVWGSDGNDNYINQNISTQSVFYNLKKGSDTIEFINIAENNRDDINRYATVTSAAETDKYGTILNKDTIILGGYHNGSTGYANKHKYDFGQNGAIKVSAVYNANNHKEILTEVTYNNFLNKTDGKWRTPDLEVKDFAENEKTCVIKRYDSVQTLDTYKSYSDDTNGTYENVEAIYIKANTGTSYITDGESYGTKSILTDGGASLDYTTTSGGDFVITNSATSNDTYNIGSSSYTTNIRDKGGIDTLNLINLRYDEQYAAQYPTDSWYNELLETYLTFNVDKDGNTDNTFVLTKSSSSNPIYSAAQYLAGKTDTANYSIIIDADKSANHNIGIETVTASKQVTTGYDSNGYNIYGQQKIADIDIENWYSTVKQDVVSWLNTNGCNSTADVFGLNINNNEDYQTFKSLCAVYEQYNANDFKVI